MRHYINSRLQWFLQFHLTKEHLHKQWRLGREDTNIKTGDKYCQTARQLQEQMKLQRWERVFTCLWVNMLMSMRRSNTGLPIHIQTNESKLSNGASGGFFSACDWTAVTTGFHYSIQALGTSLLTLWTGVDVAPTATSVKGVRRQNVFCSPECVWDVRWKMSRLLVAMYEHFFSWRVQRWDQSESDHWAPSDMAA